MEEVQRYKKPEDILTIQIRDKGVRERNETIGSWFLLYSCATYGVRRRTGRGESRFVHDLIARRDHEHERSGEGATTEDTRPIDTRTCICIYTDIHCINTLYIQGESTQNRVGQDGPVR